MSTLPDGYATMNSRIIDIVHVVRRPVPVFELLTRVYKGVTANPASMPGTMHRI